MAVYNQVLLYTFRDSLASGDPSKTIKGAYLDGEFSAIHTASLDAVSLSQNNTIAGNNSFTGTNTFAGAGITTTFAGKIIVGAPASGVPITVNANNNADCISLNDGTETCRLQTDPSHNFYFGINGAHNLVLRTSNTDRITMAGTGAITMAAPTAGTALTVNGLAGNNTIRVVAPNTSGQSFGISIAAGTNGSDYGLAITDAAAGHFLLDIKGDGSTLIGWNGSGNVISSSAAGAITLSAPSGGTTLTVNQSGTTPAIIVQGGTNPDVEVTDGIAIAKIQCASATALFGTESNHASAVLTNNIHRIDITNSGAVTINQPSSAVVALTVNSAATDGILLVGPAAGDTNLKLSLNGSAAQYQFSVRNSSNFLVIRDTVANADRFQLTNGGDIIARGIAICKVKTSATSRASTTTPSADPDLAYTIPATGTYCIEMLIACDEPAGATNTSITCGIGYTGTFSHIANISGDFLVEGVGASAALTTSTGSIAAPASVAKVVSVGAGQTALFRVTGTLIATSTGTVSFSWAQNSSDTHALTVEAGSYMKVTQLT